MSKEVEAKVIDRIAKEEIKKTCYNHSNNIHLFTIGFKQCIRYMTGRNVKYQCTKKCNADNCGCKSGMLNDIDI